MLMLCRLGVLIMYKDVFDKVLCTCACGINVVDPRVVNVLCDVN